MSASSLTVLVVDDHELVRAGMVRLLEENEQIHTVVEASSGEEALELAAQQAFDIVLMDIKLPGISGLTASERLLRKKPESLIIMVTGSMECGPVKKLLNAGVRGYITKSSSAREMEQAMQKVIAGEQYLSSDVAQQLAIDSINGNTDDQDPFEKLTSRELEIIDLLMQGLRNRQISSQLNISEKTVSTHRTRAFDKLGVDSSTELVRLAIRHNRWNDD